MDQSMMKKIEDKEKEFNNNETKSEKLHAYWKVLKEQDKSNQNYCTGKHTFLDNTGSCFADLSTVEEIFRATAKCYMLAPDCLKIECRRRDAMYARHAALYLVRQMTNLSIKEIGNIFGERDHFVIASSIRHVKENIQKIPEVSDSIKEITYELNTCLFIK